MPDSDTDGAPCTCKVGRTAAAHGLGDIHDELERRWVADEESVRTLAESFNRRVLRAAIEQAGRTPLDGEVENLHRLLTADDVDAGSRTQARERLRQRGVAVGAVEDGFVSHQTMYRHLVDCLGASQEPTHGDADSRIETWRERLLSLRTRTARVTGRGIEQLRDAGDVDAGSFEVYVDVNVSCADCGGFYTIEEFLDGRGCDCESPDGPSR